MDGAGYLKVTTNELQQLLGKILRSLSDRLALAKILLIKSLMACRTMKRQRI
ncbi:hypothetical protein BT69DRAFT_1291294 [Atractiella rhizophila]|nr:hypothetical protein BT69DRAFT_1291294 [Atractiella rhizophila]